MNLPFDVVNSLGIKEGDEVDFIRYNAKSFLFAKKSDLLSAIEGKPSAEQPSGQRSSPSPAAAPEEVVTEKELDVLKVLDSIRYAERTSENISKALKPGMAQTLSELQKRKIVNTYKKDDGVLRYGIAKWVYDKYLYGKRPAAEKQQKERPSEPAKPLPSKEAQPKKWILKLTEHDAFTELLESQGYLVIANTPDAERLSAMLEESIRMGLVLGTRAFNRKFYVALRSYINKYASKILGLISDKAKPVSEIAEEIGVDEDGVRTILYILSESGEVVERRKDSFKAA